jgi:hypothetical protein
MSEGKERDVSYIVAQLMVRKCIPKAPRTVSKKDLPHRIWNYGFEKERGYVDTSFTFNSQLYLFLTVLVKDPLSKRVVVYPVVRKEEL